MEKYIWLFPVLFIFHDLEEIIGFNIWQSKNKEKVKKKVPLLAATYEKMFTDFSTEGMALAVFEIFCICIVICLAAEFGGFYQLWLGTFIGFILHLVMHVLQAVVMKSYIPALATSLLTLPPSLYIVSVCLPISNYSGATIILWTAIGLVLIVANVKAAHSLMHWFTKKMRQWQ